MALLRERGDALASPYLRQHAANPVDWREWDEEAFALARELDRPVFISVGYAACHWCHVMAHESFEDAQVAAQLNEGFVSVKVDREERPDVDAIYMAATIAMSGHGGWPMSVFTTPDGRPFFAGTYFPPIGRDGQPSFAQLLDAVGSAWRDRRDEIESSADELARAVSQETRFVDRLVPRSGLAPHEVCGRLVDDLVARLDPPGGFGGAPKFPRPSYVEALLRSPGDPRAVHAARATLDAMARGGLYDHLDGGFARYSVDAHWHVPHFEKMLSDQALLARCYLRASRAVADGDTWRDVGLATLRWTTTALSTPDGLAASLDADAGGVEGSHVTWTPEELRSTLASAGLGHLAERAAARWSVEGAGDLEGRCVPRLAPDEPWTTPEDLREAREALLAVRRRRLQPTRDDKVILEWNAMFAAAACESGDRDLLRVAIDLLDKVTSSHFDGVQWWRTGSRTAPATASDLAWLIEAHLCAYEATGDDAQLDAAGPVVEYLLVHHWDGERPTPQRPDVGAGVFSGSDLVADLFQRPKDLFDGATPSSHSATAVALARYAALTEDPSAAGVARRLVDLAGAVLAEHPTAVPDLVVALGHVADGVELVLPGPPGPLGDLVRSRFVPSSVLVTGHGRSPLLEGRSSGSAYLCRQRVCELPTSDPARLRTQLDQLARRFGR